MKNKLNIIIPIVYLILCIFISFNRVPFWDEARAWLIAQNCNPIEFLSMMKLECHLSLWFLFIFPFAKTNFLYPYSIYLINALFAFGAIFVLWKKSPFNVLEKILITFGVPFLFLWGSVARCYAVGIFFLFLALKFYKIRFRKPYHYLILLCLSAHTSIMAFIGSFCLLIIFLFENKKSKNFLKLLGLFLISNILILIQIYDPNPDYLKQMPEMMFFRDFCFYLFNPLVFVEEYKIQSILMSLLRICVLISVFGFSIFAYKKNKKALFFILSTYFLMITLFAFFYSGNFWHYFYFYLYFIVLVWILKKENKLPKFLEILFISILILFVFKGSLFINSKLTVINNSKSNLISKEILQNYQNKKLFCLDAWSDIVPSSLPYLNDIVIYDKNNQDRKSFKSMRNQIKFNLELFNPDDFAPYVDDNSILITTSVFIRHEQKNPMMQFDKKTGVIKFEGAKHTVSFIPYKSRNDIGFWSYLIKVDK